MDRDPPSAGDAIPRECQVIDTSGGSTERPFERDASQDRVRRGCLIEREGERIMTAAWHGDRGPGTRSIGTDVIVAPAMPEPKS